MAVRRRLTKTYVDSLPGDVAKEYAVWDEECPRLCGSAAPTRPWRVEGVVVKLCETCAEGA